ncbi:hypothetical protein ACKWTF_002427 [Chironomus riparius]
MNKGKDKESIILNIQEGLFLNAMKFEEKGSAMCERLNCGNYRVWVLKMKMILIKEDLWDVIDPGSSKPEDAVKSLKALAHIVLMVDNDRLKHVSDAKDGKDA